MTTGYYKRGNTMVNGFLHTEGRLIKNEAGETVILRGWAMGGWMVVEGYLNSGIGFGLGHGMTPLDGDPKRTIYNQRFDRTRTMNDAIRELCGTDYAKSFWARWYRNMVTEDDIRELAEQGYNSVRLPLDAAGFLPEELEISWNEDSFEMLADIIGWCEKYRIYAILDLHASVGGQSSVSCDGGIDNMPRLFTEPESYERTILLWEELARRYRDRAIVAGYELLNEPIALPWSHYLRPELRRFYDETIERIRKIDKKHLIFLQDSSFAHDTDVFDEKIDPECHNWVMAFHDHHPAPELKSITKWLEASIRLNVPVWFGEGSAPGSEAAFFLDMLQDLGIGFNYFSWKAMETTDGHGTEANTYPQPQDWQKIIDYILFKGARPSYRESRKIFDELLECTKYAHYKHYDPKRHIDALKKQGTKLYGVFYDSIFKKPDAFSHNWNYSNVFSFRPEDHTKLVLKPEGKMPGLFDRFGAPAASENLCLELNAGEHADYTVYDITASGRAELQMYVKEDSVLTISFTNLEDESVIRKDYYSAASETQVNITTDTLPLTEACCLRVFVESGKIQLTAIQF